MKVLLGGYLAKPLVVPLATMISEAAPVDFEAIGAWVAESEGIASEIPITPLPRFLFSFKMSQARQRPSSEGKAATVSNQPSSLRQLLLSRTKDIAYEVAYHLDAQVRKKSFQALTSQYDVIHLHSVFDSITSIRASIVGVNRPLVLTLWGSDVLRTNAAAITARQQRLLDRATLVTCSTPEFREIILAKYGRHLAPKLRETYFSINEDVVQQIVRTNKIGAREQFGKKYAIPDNALVVCVGHNASPAGQQADVIRSIGAHSANIERPIYIVVPMTYCQTDKGYLDHVREELRAQQLDGVVLTDFMDDQELCELRRATDIFIYAAVSDVFSATISQGLIAGQVVITGSWLPNRARKRAGCVFWEMDDVSEAGEKLAELCGKDWEEAKESIKNNEIAGRNFFDSHRLGTEWYNVYQESIRIWEQT